MDPVGGLKTCHRPAGVSLCLPLSPCLLLSLHFSFSLPSCLPFFPLPPSLPVSPPPHPDAREVRLVCWACVFLSGLPPLDPGNISRFNFFPPPPPTP